MTDPRVIELIQESMVVRSYFDTVRSTNKTAEHFNISNAMASRLVAIAYIPQLVLEKITGDRWKVSYLDRIIRLRYTKDGYTLSQVGHGQLVDLTTLDYSELNRAVDLVNDGQFKNRQELESHIIQVQSRRYTKKTNARNRNSKAESEEKLRESIRQELLDEQRKKHAVKIAHLIINARNKASQSATTMANIIYGLGELMSTEDRQILSEDIEREIRTLQLLQRSLSELHVEYIVIQGEG